jgi:hypothetical protein
VSRDQHGVARRGLRPRIAADGISEDELVAAAHDADLLLMCYTPVPHA